MLAIRSYRELSAHPLYGASWEGFALEQVIRVLGLRESECFTYAVHSGDEMDLVVERAGRRYGFEFKASANPGASASMYNSIRDLELTKVYVVYPGEQNYGLHDKIEAVAVRNLSQLRERWEIA